MKVYVIAEPTINWWEYARFLEDEKIQTRPQDPYVRNVPDMLCEMAGRICYMSYGKGRTTQGFIENIVKSGHHSVLEHANFTLFITGISRSCSHEIVRHRHLSFSQLSQRYVDESQAEIIMPEIIGQIGSGDVFERAVNSARTAYQILVSNLELSMKDVEDKTLRRKAARQAARAVLPNATETKIAITGNARAWREFIVKRASVHADVEIRTLAVMIYNALAEHSVSLFADLQEQVDACASI
jgi:thymidylate synthase (FAD)